MTKKTPEEAEPAPEVAEVIQDIPEGDLIATVIMPDYQTVMWSGVIRTFQCQTCFHCDTDEDGMILHVITHFPKDEQENQLEKLLKEKK